MNAGFVCSRIAVSGSSPSAAGSTQPPPSWSRYWYVASGRIGKAMMPRERVDRLRCAAIIVATRRRDGRRRRRAASSSGVAERGDVGADERGRGGARRRGRAIAADGAG